MKVTSEKNEKVARMIFASIYPLYWNRLEKKGRTKKEFHQVITWFTGYDEAELQKLIQQQVSFRTFLSRQRFTQMLTSSKGWFAVTELKKLMMNFSSTNKLDKWKS